MRIYGMRRIPGMQRRSGVRVAVCCGLGAVALVLMGTAAPGKAEKKDPPRDKPLQLKVELADPRLVVKSVADGALKLLERLGPHDLSRQFPMWDANRHSFLNALPPSPGTREFSMIVVDPDPEMTYGMPRLVPDADKSYTMPQVGAPQEGPVLPPDPRRNARPEQPPRFRIEVQAPSESPQPDKEKDQQPERAPTEGPESNGE